MTPESMEHKTDKKKFKLKVSRQCVCWDMILYQVDMVSIWCVPK